MSLRIIFAGSPTFAVPVLSVLYQSSHELVAVYTKPDRPAGRGRKLLPCAVKTFALEHHLPVYQPQTLREATAQQQLADLDADIMVVAGYGMILPKAVLNIPRFGCINIHPSLLPRWRGATPVQATLLAGDTKTGVTIFQLDEKMDTGDILAQKIIKMDEQITSDQLYDQLFQIGSKLLLDVLADIEKGTISPIPQDETKASYCKMIQKSDAEINWSQSANQIANQVRAYHSWPVAYTQFKGQRLRIWKAIVINETSDRLPGTIIMANHNIDVATGQGLLRLLEVQLPGGRVVSASDFVNANQASLLSEVTRLGNW